VFTCLFSSPHIYSSLLRVRGVEVAKKGGKTLQKGGSSCSKSHDPAGEAGGKAGARPGQLGTRGAQRTSVPHGPHPRPLHGCTRTGEEVAVRNSLLLREGAGSWPQHTEGLGGGREPQTQIWPREGRSSRGPPSSCSQPSRECGGKAGQQGLGLGPLAAVPLGGGRWPSR